MNSKDIVIIGSSFMSRLHNELCGKSHKMCNLRFDPDFVQVAWFAAGGLTYRKLHGEGPQPPLESLLHVDAAIIHLCGNDLCDRNPNQVLGIIESWTITTLQRLGCAKIVFCCVFHRRQGRLTNRLNLVYIWLWCNFWPGIFQSSVALISPQRKLGTTEILPNHAVHHCLGQ